MKSEVGQRADIGPRLIEVAEGAGYNMSQLARRLGIANTTVNGWKKGAEPRVAYVDEVAHLANESLMYLIRGKRDTNKDAPPPEFEAWRDAMMPGDVTADELATLAGFRFRTRHPGPQWYAIALAGMRTSPMATGTLIRTKV